MPRASEACGAALDGIRSATTAPNARTPMMRAMAIPASTSPTSEAAVQNRWNRPTRSRSVIPRFVFIMSAGPRRLRGLSGPSLPLR